MEAERLNLPRRVLLRELLKDHMSDSHGHNVFIGRIKGTLFNSTTNT
jgi:hypothetical protein